MSFLHFWEMRNIKATRKSQRHMLIIHTQLLLCQESLDPNRALNISALTEELIVVNKIFCFTDNQRPSRTWGDESPDSQRKHPGTLPPPSCWSWSPLWERDGFIKQGVHGRVNSEVKNIDFNRNLMLLQETIFKVTCKTSCTMKVIHSKVIFLSFFLKWWRKWIFEVSRPHWIKNHSPVLTNNMDQGLQTPNDFSRKG